MQGAFHVGASVGGRNGVTAKCRYREIGGSWSNYTAIEDTSAVVGGSMPATKTYEMEIAATDSIGETKTVYAIIPTAEVALHLRDGGKGAAFGKYAEKEALECAWDAEFGGNVVVGDACIGQNGQISGTGLRSTAHSDLGATPGSYPVFHDGWLYSRTLAEMRADLAAYETVPLTVVSGRLTDLIYTARYYPMLGMCFVRIYGVVSKAMSQGADYDLLNIGSRTPAYNTALAVKCGKKIHALAKSNGVIVLRPHDDGINGYDIYIAGWWLI